MPKIILSKITAIDIWKSIRHKIIWRRVIIASVIIVALFVIWAVYLHFIKGYVWANWTGFGEYTGNIPKDNRGKTFWDWMQLLIIPAVLAGGALWFNWQARKIEEKGEEKRTQIEHEIANERYREEALQTYFNIITELLLREGLRERITDQIVRDIARTRTISILRTLDGERRGLLLKFLYDAHLISKENSIIALNGAELKGSNLSMTDLRKVILRDANLSKAQLYKAILIEADLRNTILIGANLSGADLTRADLTGAVLGGADLIGADLTDAILDRADLYSHATVSFVDGYVPTDWGPGTEGSAKIAEKQLEKARSLKHIMLPNGKSSDDYFS